MSKIRPLIIIVTFILSLVVMANEATAADDLRVIQMRSYLESVKSPMVGHEQIIIDTAMKYGLDWTLLAAIAGTESTFGKRMPHQCVNPYGWGIYGTNKLCFRDFAEAITKVGEGIGTKYNTNSLQSIAKKYNTVGTAKWIASTQFFMNKIKNQPVAVKNLPIEI